jgi:hypothetical protein
MGYLIKVILTGLVIAAVPPNEDPQRVLALALDDGPDHQAMLILMEGTCEPEVDCRQSLAGVPDEDLERFELVWDVESMENAVLKLVGPTAGVRRRDVIFGEPGPLPQPGQQTDFHWIPSLTTLAKASGIGNPKLPDSCFDDLVEGCGVVAQLEVPFGEIGACHLVHYTHSTLPGSEHVCDFSGDQETSAAHVLRHEYRRPKSVEQWSGMDQAITDAVSIDYTSADPQSLVLSIKNGIEVTLQPDMRTGRLVLMLLNQPVGDLLGDVHPAKIATDRHPHFDMFYELFNERPPAEQRLAPKVPHLQRSHRTFIDPGPCEPYFGCLSYVMGGVHRLTAEQFEPGAETRRVLMPHNPSQCDVPTYP